MRNFGKIKNAFYNLLVESIIFKNDKKKAIFGEYIKAIRENKILRTEFLVYTNLEDKSELNENKANDFAKRNIQFLREFKRSDIEKANQSLIEKLGEYQKNLEKPYDGKLTKLHEAITDIIFMKNNPLYVEMLIESYDSITQYIKDKISKDVIKENLVPTDALAIVAINKFNEKYSELTEDEKLLIKTITENDEKIKEDTHKEIVNECIGLIDQKLNENDGTTKEKLIKAKSKLQTITYTPENYIDDLNKLIVLKNDLTNN